MNEASDLVPVALSAVGLILVLVGAGMNAGRLRASHGPTGAQVNLARRVFLAGWIIVVLSAGIGMLYADAMLHEGRLSEHEPQNDALKLTAHSRGLARCWSAAA